MKNPWIYRVKLKNISEILTREFKGQVWNDDLTEKIIHLRQKTPTSLDECRHKSN